MLLFGLGNPLLDIVVNVSDEFLEEFHIKRGCAYLYDKTNHHGIFEKVLSMPGAILQPGSATLNTIRVFQALHLAMNGVKGVAGYSGCVGNDKYGEILEKQCIKEGVVTMFVRAERGFNTGRCAVLVNGNDRTMVTELGACEQLRIDDFSSWEHVKAAKVIYSAGFHLTVCPELMQCLARYCAEAGKLFMTCLCDAFIPQHFAKQLTSVLINADVVFGNMTEFGSVSYDRMLGVENHETYKTFAAKLSAADLPDPTIKDKLRWVANVPFSNGRSDRRRLVICTDGAKNTLAYMTGMSEVFEITPSSMNEADIVDTNGAGDSFIAGFIFAYCSVGYTALPNEVDKLKKLIQVGHYAAQHVIKHNGCTFDFAEEAEKLRSLL